MTTQRTLILGILFALTLCALPRPAAADACDNIKQFLADKALRVVCFHSSDLRTNTTTITDPTTQPPTGPTTPPNNSITTFANGNPLPGPTIRGSAFSFTPVRDRGGISNNLPPTSGPSVPGIQVEGWFADDPSGEARFLLRFPDDWNGKLVVAGAAGRSSEFNGDFAWSDYVVSKRYAYASQNKGILNVYFVLLGSATPPQSDSLACRLFPTSLDWEHFYDDDPQKPFTLWTQYMLETARLAQEAAKVHYHDFPRRTYAVGTSLGGYQVRRAMEEGHHLFDGGVDWEGAFIDTQDNVLVTLPPAIKSFAVYQANYNDPNSAAAQAAAQAIEAAGYPPDIVKRDPVTHAVLDSLWLHYSNDFWEVTACQWQKRFDPTYNTYVDGLGNYDYLSRLTPAVFAAVDAVETTGKIIKPLITVAGTMDALLPIKRQARAYEERVLDSRERHHDHDCDRDCDDHDRHHHPPYRLYEVQNGNHIESYTLLFPGQLEVIQPHAQKAFDLLVDYVEHNRKLPPSQCIPRGGAIANSPSEPGHCANLFVP